MPARAVSHSQAARHVSFENVRTMKQDPALARYADTKLTRNIFIRTCSTMGEMSRSPTFGAIPGLLFATEERL